MKFSEIPEIDSKAPQIGGLPSSDFRAGNALESGTAERRRFGRRSALKGAGIGAVALAGVSVIDLVGGRDQALAALPPGATCFDAHGFQYGTPAENCFGVDYPTTCDNGCARPAAVSSNSFCVNGAFQSNHRTCGQDRIINGQAKKYALRLNVCYAADKDGWLWRETSNGTCGCAAAKWSSCNDGWYSTDGGVNYARSICVTQTCGF